jgi:hypothetical protein
MDEAKRLAYAAWEQIFILGKATVDIMKSVSQQIQEAQQST